MTINVYNERDSFSLLPSITIQRCFRHYFVYFSIGTLCIEFAPDENNIKPNN